MGNESNENDDLAFILFLFCNIGGCHKSDLISMILIVNQYTVDLFFNKNLVTRV